mgnify:CR=1 FL=1
MKYSFIAIFTFVLLLTACTTNKLQFDKMSYYTGNGSLPPPYQEHLTITVDSTQGSAEKTIGDIVTDNSFEINAKDYKKLTKLAKAFISDSTKLGEFADGGGLSRVQLYKGDTLVYDLSYQSQHKVGKAISKFTKTLESLTPETGLPGPLDEEREEGGE